MNTLALVQSRWESPLGPLTLLASERGLRGLWFDGQRHHPGPLAAPVAPAQRWITAAREQLAAYFAGERRSFELPLDLAGTPFQQRVWALLRTIEPGRTRSYGAIAQALGQPGAARACGAAIGRNPVSIVVPCHRVLGGDGGLTGYAGGLSRKQALLALEAHGGVAARAAA